MCITIYSKPGCVQCTATYRWADSLGLDYTVVDVTRDPEALDAVTALGYLSVPVVVVRDADGNIIDHWAGFQPDALDRLASLDPSAPLVAA